MYRFVEVARRRRARVRGSAYVQILGLIALAVLLLGVMVRLGSAIAQKYGDANEVVQTLALGPGFAGARGGGSPATPDLVAPTAGTATAVRASTTTPTAALTAATPGMSGAMNGVLGDIAGFALDIPRGAYAAVTGDRSCQSLGCQTGRDLLSSVPSYSIGDLVEGRELFTIYGEYQRGEAALGDVVNQAVVVALPGITGVAYRHAVKGVAAGTEVVARATRASTAIPQPRPTPVAINALKRGEDVSVRSFKEADEVLFGAFPEARKMPGSGPRTPEQVRKLRADNGDTSKGVFHRDYMHDPDPRANGALYGHQDQPLGHPHRSTPHINVLTPGGDKATIYILH
jgi:hypothetical protein